MMVVILWVLGEGVGCVFWVGGIMCWISAAMRRIKIGFFECSCVVVRSSNGCAGFGTL